MEITKKNTDKSISNSLETTEDMLPYIPYLLQDLWALGSSVKIILDLLGRLKLPKTAKVLDLGCGKGAVSIQIASRFGLHVTGIDAMEAFLQDAVRKSKENNVENLCEFIKEDIILYTLNEHDYDIVVLASLGGVFGSAKDTIRRLRTQVKKQGYMIVDDGYLKKSDFMDRKGYEHCRNHHETVKELISFGDKLVNEMSTDEISKDINEEYLTLIKRRGAELIVSHPELKEEINNYILVQEEECRVLDDEIGGAVWLLRRSKSEANFPFVLHKYFI